MTNFAEKLLQQLSIRRRLSFTLHTVLVYVIEHSVEVCTRGHVGIRQPSERDGSIVLVEDYVVSRSLVNPVR